MLSLDELLHPITPAQFRAEYQDRKPLHIPASPGGRKQAVLPWSAFNTLLNQPVVWTAQNMKLMRDHLPVPTEQYCKMVQSPTGRVMRPWPQKVEMFLSTGASLVANDVLQLHAPLTEIGQMLGRTFAAGIGANIYCSFNGVQAFGTHFDNHDVFVVHTEGEKVWNLYENRDDNPVDPAPDNLETRRWFEQNRGALMAEVHMKPGDVLYLPRGWFHDALAKDEASLHVTFSVNPLYGRILLSLLDNAAMQNSAFREYFPPAQEDGGKALQARLIEMGKLLASITASPNFLEEVKMTQERIQPRAPSFALPERKPITLYRTTGRAFPPTSIALRQTYEWAMAEQQFAIEDMIADFDFVSEADIRTAIAAAEQLGSLQRV